MKKLFALSLTFLLLALSACASNPSTAVAAATPDPSPATVSAPVGSYELEMWLLSEQLGDEQAALFDKWREEFLGLHPEIKALEFVTKSESELLSGITAGEELPDVLLGSLTYGRAFLETGRLLELSQLLSDAQWSAGFYPDALEAVLTEGGYWALPFSSTVPLLWRNLDALESAGIDISQGESTMDTLLAHMQAVNDAGLVATHSWSSGGIYAPGSILAADYDSLGEPMETLEGKTTIESTALRRSFDYILRFNEQGNSWAYSDEAALEAFKAGKMAYLLGGPEEEKLWQQSGINCDAVLIPPYEEESRVYGGFLGWDGLYAIDSGDEGKNRAIMDWLRYLGSFETMRDYSLGSGRASLRRTVMEDEQVLEQPLLQLQALGMERSRLRIDYFDRDFYWIAPIEELAVQLSRSSITGEEAAELFVEELNALYAEN